MAVLPILHFPNPRLHIKAVPVAAVDGTTRQLIRDMAETMYAAPGIGLAATQVDVHKQVAVIDISDDHSELLVFVNASIIKKSGECDSEEGCLSVPGVHETVRRAEWVKVRALNEKGEPFELEADGLLAVCIQHELDHLDGKVFVEYLSRLKQGRIKSRLLKQAQDAAS
ncbi:peptide deformylase [Azonexus sp.]|uniref:peptide deformylase n=1 Tax=Azonexus sp. TaxID=1872668 RepID=UPI00281957C6|nr:peptide deformylase [Azonexus sp.]MDR1994759.1 peptide deformylase [Azonexus sp.]